MKYINILIYYWKEAGFSGIIDFKIQILMGKCALQHGCFPSVLWCLLVNMFVLFNCTSITWRLRHYEVWIRYYPLLQVVKEIFLHYNLSSTLILPRQLRTRHSIHPLCPFVGFVGPLLSDVFLLPPPQYFNGTRYLIWPSTQVIDGACRNVICNGCLPSPHIFLYWPQPQCLYNLFLQGGFPTFFPDDSGRLPRDPSS